MQTGPCCSWWAAKPGLMPMFLLGPDILTPKPTLGGGTERVALGERFPDCSWQDISMGQEEMCIKTMVKFSHKPSPSAFTSVLCTSCTTSSPQQWLRRSSVYLPNPQGSRWRRPGASPCSSKVLVRTCPLPPTCLGPWAGSSGTERGWGWKTPGSSTQLPRSWGTGELGHWEEGVEGKSSGKMSHCATEGENSL